MNNPNLNRKKYTKFYNISTECLLAHVLSECDKFNQAMYALKKEEDYLIKYELDKYLKYDAYDKQISIFQICDVNSVYHNVKIDTSKFTIYGNITEHQRKTQQKHEELSQAVSAQIMLELNMLSKWAPKSQIIATLISRDLIRIKLCARPSVVYLMHDGKQIKYDSFSERNAKFTQTLILKTNGKFTQFNEIYDQVLQYVKECKTLNLPLVYNSSLLIPITGFSPITTF